MKIKNRQMIWHLFGYFIYMSCAAINLHNVLMCLQKGGLEGWMLLSMFNTAFWVAFIAKHSENWKAWERQDDRRLH